MTRTHLPAPWFLAALSSWASLAGCGAPATPAPNLAAVDFGGDVPPREAALLRDAPALELLALDPAPPTPEQLRDPARFHGYGVLGRAVVTDPAKRLALLDLLARSGKENDGTAAACFNPRHGVRAEVGGHTAELVICFECLTWKVFGDGTFAANGDTSQTHEPEVSALYRAEGLTIAPR